MRKGEWPFRKFSVLTGIGLMLLIALALIAFFIFFLITGFFKLFGVSYESHTSILLFMLGCFLIGGIFEFIGKVLNTMSFLTFENRKIYLFLKFMIDFLMNLVTFRIVDQLMTSIFIPSNTLFIAAAFIAVIEVVFDETNSKSRK
ncbi:YrvL family regulatory protein [Bacillus sp. z60-18]|uniref:YrvL family regulatory protein n=1 Tax=Bacillus TaxID=1386 RepID=UPI00098AC157